VRLRALRDPTSVYYRAYCEMMRQASDKREEALAMRRRVVVPFMISNDIRLDCERKFPMWRVEVQDFGLRDRMEPHAGAVLFLMNLRGSMVVSMDGEEVVEVDGDIPAKVAKGETFVHVCRSYASDRLAASYQWEDMQLRSLTFSKNPVIAAQARAALCDLETDGGGAVACHSARLCRRRADVVRICLPKTPVSLAQAIATANARGATEVHVDAFFQVEMLMADEGELQCFPGSYLVNKSEDVISFLPRGDPGAGFSVPFSSLTSFFLNHAYRDGKVDWVVEKFLGEHGMFHCVARRVESEGPYEFPSELGANYYTSAYSRWVRIHYPRRVLSVSGVPTGAWEEAYDDIPEVMYGNLTSQLMAVDVKRLTLEEVFISLRNSNNNVFSNGDTVRLPERVWSEVTSRLTVPLLARIVMRREALSAQLGLGLRDLERRFGVLNDGLLSVLIAAAAAVVDKARVLTVRALLGDELAVIPSLDGVRRSGVSFEIRVEEISDHLAVRQMVGRFGAPLAQGRFEPWLPGPSVRGLSLLKRAMAFAGGMTRVLGSASASSASSCSGEAESYEDAPEWQAPGPVSVSQHVGEEALVVPELTARQHEVLDKLVAEQDASLAGRVPRLVRRFEGAGRTDVIPVPALTGDALVVAQDDYDRIFPAAVADDEEIKSRLAAEADLVRNVCFHGSVNESKRELPLPRVIRRCRAKTAGAAEVARCQFSTMTALFKRNAEVPNTRGFVDLDAEPARVVDRVIDVCFREDWKGLLNVELEEGLWTPCLGDLEEYVPKLETHKAEAILREFFMVADVDLRNWVIMTKARAKPPLDAGAASKVQQPQTIMYSESKSANAMYSAMCTRFFHALDSFLLPNVRFNHRQSPWEHEEWFNSLNPVRASCTSLHSYEGDIWNYDRSQEMFGFAVEFELYRRTGLNAAVLEKWKETHGEKRAVSAMYGILMYLVQQGLSGIYKTLLRNGVICLAAVVFSTDLQRGDLVSLSVTGDDCLLEMNRTLGVGMVVDGMALAFNLSVKFYGVDVMYFCSRYWVEVDGWWYWVKDPVKQFESSATAIIVGGGGATLVERHVALRDDLRHYDNALVCDALAKAVKGRMGLRFEPHGLIRGLAAWASSLCEMARAFGPEEVI